jgi:hypothetical protein
MAFLIAQGAGSLYKIDLTTGTETALTLPTGVTLSTTRKPKFAVLKNFVVMVNSPSRNLAIDAEGTVRVLVPVPPTHGPDPSVTGTGLTGSFKYYQDFFVKDSDGNVLMRSPLSDFYKEISPANQSVLLSDIANSPDSVTGKGIYRNLTGGTAKFHLLDIEDNTTRSILDGASDDTLELLPSMADELLSPPGTVPGVRMKTIVEWKSRLFGVSNIDPDTVWITEQNKPWAWTHKLVAHPSGSDHIGIVGFAPRRDHLGIIKRNGVWQISAQSGSTGIDLDDVSVQQISPRGGSLSPDTIVVWNDRAWWLGNDGWYEWSYEGVKNISDELVAPWFTSDTYFTRSRFPNAFAKMNEARQCVELHLAAAGSSVEDRWVQFSLLTRKFYGPHKTGLFTPSHAAHLVDENGLPVCIVGGSNGVVYTANSANARDGAATAIDMDCYGPFHHGGNPDAFHHFGELSFLSKIQGSGNLTITPYVGGLDASAGATISHDMTLGRQLLRRLGQGRLVRLRVQQATVNVAAVPYGYEFPAFEIARR